VVEQEDGNDDASTKLAASVWYELRNSGQLRDDIDIIFTRIQPRHDVTVDNVIECELRRVLDVGLLMINLNKLSFPNFH